MKTNPVIENIMSRRSIRKFEERPVPHEDLETIVTCGQWAPSAMNRQEWTFVVMEDAARIAQLAEVMGAVLVNEAYDMYRPQAAIIVAHKKGAAFGREDDGCALQTMFLAAHSLGIGSVWINQLQGICNEPDVRAELDALGVPADYEVHGICALGYAAAETAPKDRKSEIVWV
ncbi:MULTISPECIES: nitroreductase family protein [Gordonibacter]|uniref:Nitroreductase family protein n=1 Tax=Gordonibacter faecis TaxID=3047475 RepID=A0ABT7DID3_9ACTN|nr:MULTISPECIES: nitroreductase family protein [unclassified Gordonibacter]MDJ1649287.1 nitroreductase family protein [Gordonibacter sp. KGMB12511]HIW75246.1 nitroreductase family protein [Candidatus Gordonibacter avicola]